MQEGLHERFLCGLLGGPSVSQTSQTNGKRHVLKTSHEPAESPSIAALSGAHVGLQVG
jgi:hypothetical protein